MARVVIRSEHLSKRYRLGLIGSGTVRADLDRWGHRARGLPYPTLRVDQHEESLESRGPAGEPSSSDIWALRDASFDIKEGEVLGVIGRNGAGKSTLLKVLSRVTAPTLGQVKIKGRIASLLEVGTGFHPELTGRENIFLNGAILGMTKSEVRDKFDNIVAFAEIERFLDTPVKRYSSGMYVRLAFAVAAHLDPEILLVDEVLAVGDAEFRKKCLGKMQDVAGHGRTVLFVSHNMAAISQLTSRCLLLQNGRIAFDGATSTAIDRYLDSTPVQTGSGKVPLEQLACDRRLLSDPRVRFRSLGLAERQSREVAIGESLGIEMDIESSVDRDGLCLGYSICDVLGAGVCSGWSPPFAVSAGKTRALVLRLDDLSLAPGRYALNLAISAGGLKGARTPLDLIIGFGHFEVAHRLSSGECIEDWHHTWGSVIHQGAKLLEA